MSLDGEILRADCLSNLPGIRHGFFTRQGGVSGGLYASLNCGLGSRDDPLLVRENRSRVARSLCATDAAVLTLHQVHSATALVVTGPIAGPSLPRADALVTRTRGLVLGALAADCAPVLFADPEAGVIAAAHAGWRGALAGVLEAAVAAMKGLGAKPSRIRAAIGPCISQEAYEVGPDFEEEFLSADPGNERFFKQGRERRRHFDLPAYAGHRLARAGVATIERRSLCTYVNESLFFSYRRSAHRKEPEYAKSLPSSWLSWSSTEMVPTIPSRRGARGD
jgi:YfiH family protein